MYLQQLAKLMRKSSSEAALQKFFSMVAGSGGVFALPLSECRQNSVPRWLVWGSWSCC